MDSPFGEELNYLEAGFLCAQQRKFAEARNYFRLAIDEDPEDAGAWTNFGTTYVQEGKYAKAIPFYIRSLELEPNNALTWYSVGKLYLETGKYAKALPYYEKAIEIDPTFEDPYLDAGNCLTDLSCHADALRLFDKALGNLPERYKLWLGKACAYANLDRLPEAIAALEYVHLLNPHCSKAASIRGDLLNQCRRKGKCMVFKTVGGVLETQIGYVYVWKEGQFISLSIDEIDEELMERDDDIPEEYHSPGRE